MPQTELKQPPSSNTAEVGAGLRKGGLVPWLFPEKDVSSGEFRGQSPKSIKASLQEHPGKNFTYKG